MGHGISVPSDTFASLGCCLYWLTDLKNPKQPENHPNQNSNQTTPLPSFPKPWQYNREEGWKCKASRAIVLTVSVRAEISSTTLQVVHASGDIRGRSRAYTINLRALKCLHVTRCHHSKTEDRKETTEGTCSIFCKLSLIFTPKSMQEKLQTNPKI